MKKGAVLTLTILFLMAATLSAQEKGPVAISPGNDMGVAVVGQSTPTFSWTAVDWATTYRVEVFVASEGQVLHYTEMAAQAYPLLVKEIRGAATAWTPSAEEQLGNEGVYVWYVQAINDMGTAAWSEGKAFTVNLAAAFAPLEEAVSDSLRENGVSQDVIDDVMSDVKTKVGERALAAGTDNPIPISVQGVETSLNTWYGLNAGDSIITGGQYNSFFGNYAGRDVTTGDANTFIGRWSGSTVTTNSNNTFMGYYSGIVNIAGNNTFLGYYSGRSNTSGTYNTFVGTNSGDSNTTASYNSFLGYQAGRANTTGHSNTMFGSYAGYTNTTASYNTFIGRNAGYANTTGFDNTFIGHLSGDSTTQGFRNTFVGKEAGGANTTADYNAFFGYAAGLLNTANQNTFIGALSGNDNTTGADNTFVGFYAGNANTTQSNNTFIGTHSGYSNSGGARNTFLGKQTGFSNSTGADNTFLGGYAGYSTNTGGSNTYVGYRAGYTNTTGLGNIFIGNQAGEDFVGNNKLFIDNTDTANPLIWGNFATDTVAFMGTVGIGTKTPDYPTMQMKKTGVNASFVLTRTDGATNFINATATAGAFGTVTAHELKLVVGGQWKQKLFTDNSLLMQNGASCSSGGTWTNASSRELKENIHELSTEDAFAALEDLNPVQYNYKADKEEDYVGFIAEDVPDLVATKDKKGMATMDVVAVLTKVVQEQQKTVDELQKVNQSLQKRLEELENKNKEK